MAGKHWGETEGANGAPIGPGSDRLSDLLGRWYGASREALGWSFDAWYDGAVRPVAAELARGTIDKEALAALGAARSGRGRTERETLDDLAGAISCAGPDVDPSKAAVARRAVIDGYRRPGAPAAWFGDSRGLSRQLRRLYAEAEGRRPPARSYALLLVDVNLTWLSTPEQAAALAATAEQMHSHFPFADLVASLGEPRFGVVVRRHPGLAVGAESLHLALEGEPLLAGATKVLLVPLPDSAAGVGVFVRELAGAQRPLRVRAYEPRAAAGGGPGAELLKAAVPISALRPARRRWRVAALVTEGSGMVAAAVAVLILAAGVGKAVGPVSVGGTPTTQLFGLSPRLALPAPESSASDVAPPAPLPVPEVVAVEVAPVEPIVNVTAEPATFAPPVVVAEAPAPEATAPPIAAPVQAVTAQAPEPTPTTSTSTTSTTTTTTPAAVDNEGESTSKYPQCDGLAKKALRECRREARREAHDRQDQDDDDD